MPEFTCVNSISFNVYVWEFIYVFFFFFFFGSEIWFNFSTINNDDPTCLLVLQNRLPIYARCYFCLFDFFHFRFINIWIHSRGLWSCVLVNTLLYEVILLEGINTYIYTTSLLNLFSYLYIFRDGFKLHHFLNH